MKFQCFKVVHRKGSHTAEHIFDVFHGIMQEYEISAKLFRAVSDNAANMRKAFNLELQTADGDEEGKEGDFEGRSSGDDTSGSENEKDFTGAPFGSATTEYDPEEVSVAQVMQELVSRDLQESNNNEEGQSLEDALSANVAIMLDNHNYSRLECCNHAFHNTVGDGLKVAGKQLNQPISKVKKMAKFSKKSMLLNNISRKLEEIVREISFPEN